MLLDTREAANSCQRKIIKERTDRKILLSYCRFKDVSLSDTNMRKGIEPKGIVYFVKSKDLENVRMGSLISLVHTKD